MGQFREMPPDAPQPRTAREQELADLYLGVTYHPIKGVYGRSRVLALQDSQIKFSGGPDRQEETFTRHVADERTTNKALATKLQCNFSVPDLVSLGATYASSTAVYAALAKDSALFTARYVSGLIYVAALEPLLSQEMINIIAQLGSWSEQNKQYDNFFDRHGTHVVLRLALGGVLNIVTRNGRNSEGQQDMHNLGLKMAAPAAANHVGAAIGHSAAHGMEESLDDVFVHVFREGGGKMASELTIDLEKHVKRSSGAQDSMGWPSAATRESWIAALRTDPVFCPDSKETEIVPIWSLGGLNPSQKSNLEKASEAYLRMRRKKDPEGSNNLPRSGERDDIARKKNHRNVFQWFKDVFSRHKHG
ncbi:hypothetical protein R3P38DRAFT_2539912 [Favolaschia claudopus]|uniref:MACPF domain-containing protein n=1 Tax=Favolaschia claudopus TaxID=2862362 RepID=A0AAW0B083_9AGAR